MHRLQRKVLAGAHQPKCSTPLRSHANATIWVVVSRTSQSRDSRCHGLLLFHQPAIHSRQNISFHGRSSAAPGGSPTMPCARLQHPWRAAAENFITARSKGFLNRVLVLQRRRNHENRQKSYIELATRALATGMGR